ncbi:MAG: hypothetical protein IT378_00750 [Sandaracinaceae bacterium]|nr:hypothetical protein [Sandaracinaceae bacterium]
MPVDVDTAKIYRIVPQRVDPVAARAQQHWDFADEQGRVFMRAEIYEGVEQWGVRVHDREPSLGDEEILRLIARLLVWHAPCPTDTVDVVLGRTHAHHTLVKVGADFV